MSNFWKSEFNVVRVVFEAFFCEYRYQEAVITFSSKKFWAFVLMLLAIMNHAELHFWPETHWSVLLSKKNVPESIVISLIASLDMLAGWALGVYAKAKAAGAA